MQVYQNVSGFQEIVHKRCIPKFNNITANITLGFFSRKLSKSISVWVFNTIRCLSSQKPM